MYYIKSSQIVLNNRKVVYDITAYKTADLLYSGGTLVNDTVLGCMFISKSRKSYFWIEKMYFKDVKNIPQPISNHK